uniref:Uncharacterized protein n=1 Tax=Rhizophora mucronata TaxID=61149 RepID=A0A2P2PVQ6_RHIMU
MWDNHQNSLDLKKSQLLLCFL